MQIRLANETDFPGILACEEKAFGMSARTGNIRDISQCSTLAAQIRNGEVYVIIGQDRILGYISYVPSNDHVFVDTIAVLPRHHRKGLGSKLLGHAEEAAAVMGLHSVKLFTDGRIAGNVTFYEQQGYGETGRCEEDEFSRIFYSKNVAA